MEEKIWFKYYDNYVKKHLEYPDVSLHELVSSRVREHLNKTALVFMQYKMTYKQLEEESNQLAHFLLKKGIGKGKQVVLVLANTPHFPVAYYGVLKAGATAVPVNPLYTARELVYFLKDSEASLVVTFDMFAERVRSACEEAGIRDVVVGSAADYLPPIQAFLYRFLKKGRGEGRQRSEGGMRDSGVERLKGFSAKERVEIGFRQALREGSPYPTGVQVKGDDLATLIYTGGTTGVSKGAMLLHRNLVANTLQCSAWFPEISQGRATFVAVMPFFHSFGLTVALNFGLYMGAEIVLIPRFHARTLLETLQMLRPPVVLPAIPSIFSAINHFPRIEQYNLSSLWVSISGGAPLPVEVQKKFEALTHSILVEGFGLTETSPVTHVNPLLGKRKEGSIGLPLPDTDVKIVDVENGEKELSAGEEGEVIIKGPQVMAGYWKNAEETAKVLMNGWLYTGDIGRMDEDGFFYIVDRKKDMVITEGFNVFPREIEEVLYTHPKVKEAAAVGVKDRLKGEVVKAFVVPKEGEILTKEEILNYCQEHLAWYKVPKSVEFLKELPRSAIGKVLRRELKEQ